MELSIVIDVYYTDGDHERFNSYEAAERGIAETVFGCDFATTVDRIELNGNPDLLACEWGLKLLRLTTLGWVHSTEAAPSWN